MYHVSFHVVMKKKIVIIGGGNGSALTINAVKPHAEILDISAVISVSDSGGSSGQLRQEFNTLPPGDLLRAALAMSTYDYKMLKQIFYKNRFQGAGKLDKHDLGNLFLVLSEQYAGNLLYALRALEQSVEAVGTVYPVALEPADLCAELNNGEIVKTEAALDEPAYDRAWKIKRVWLEPVVSIYDEARRVIEAADFILLSPGSLYTSVIATLLPDGVHEAIAASRAQLIYISGDAYEINGETGPERLSDFVRELEAYLPRQLDQIVYNSHVLDAAQKKKYAEKQWAQFAGDIDNLADRAVIATDYETAEGSLSPVKLGEILHSVIARSGATKQSP